MSIGFIDLFAGCGGLSTGLKMAGLEPVVAVESNAWAAETFARNHTETTVICSDVRETSGSVLASGFGGNVPLVVGGPPCQGFSAANRQSLGGEQNNLVREFVRLVLEVRPTAFLMEQVPMIINWGGGVFVEEIRSTFSEAGYDVSFDVLNACQFGVPQTRRRAFFTGISQGESMEFPRPTHYLPSELTKFQTVFAPGTCECSFLEKCVTVRDALSDLPDIQPRSRGVSPVSYECDPKSRFQALMRQGNGESVHNHVATVSSEKVTERYGHVPPGGNWRSIPKELLQHSKVRHSSLYYRLHPDRPSKTITNFRKSMFIAPFSDRQLSVREAARMQSYPDWFTWSEEVPISAQQQMVANSVPPMLGFHLGLALKKAVGDSR